ncbi:unnamed protein product [Ranitomeya imitator]|uniref:Uncharacterized protein n=1 Tax=Ranitomeya imitator TaxID=111125 RepID=A0ABN9LM72_9NEOB|nr:unnamed protein product [Ranitomeya imitator]
MKGVNGREEEDETSVKIITQQVQPSKILPKPMSASLPNSSNTPIMVVSSNGAIMTTKLVTAPSEVMIIRTPPDLVKSGHGWIMGGYTR